MGLGVCYSWWKGRRPPVMGAPQKQRPPSQVLLMSSGDLPPTANKPRTNGPVFVPVETAAVRRLGRLRRWPEIAKSPIKQRVSLVPVERIELPTFGLQNRCSTAELNRLTR